MNLSPSFAASFEDARPVAQHCPELTERGPRPEDRADSLSMWCRDLGYELGGELAQLFSGEKIAVSIAQPETLAGAAVFEKIGAVAVNNLIRCGSDEHIMLLSLDLATTIALTECSFGGEGMVPTDVPAQLPRSAGLLVEQFAGLVAQTIALVSGTAENAQSDLLARSESVKRLKPFGPGEKVAVFNISIAMGAFIDWPVMLALPADRLDGLLPGMGGNKPPRKTNRTYENGLADAFAEMPLPLEAVLSEFSLSLGKLEQLAPGDEFPLAIPRDLPLRIGGEVMAYGMLGTVENQMALKLTRLDSEGDAQAGEAEFAPAFASSEAMAPAGGAGGAGASSALGSDTQPLAEATPVGAPTSSERQRLQGLTA